MGGGSWFLWACCGKRMGRLTQREGKKKDGLEAAAREGGVRVVVLTAGDVKPKGLKLGNPSGGGTGTDDGSATEFASPLDPILVEGRAVTQSAMVGMDNQPAEDGDGGRRRFGQNAGIDRSIRGLVKTGVNGQPGTGDDAVASKNREQKGPRHAVHGVDPTFHFGCRAGFSLPGGDAQPADLVETVFAAGNVDDGWGVHWGGDGFCGARLPPSHQGHGERQV